MLIELRTPSLIKKIIQLTLSPRFNKPIHESDRQQQILPLAQYISNIVQIIKTKESGGHI